LNFECLSQLQKQGTKRGLPTFKKENARCEACIYGKHNQEASPIGSWRAKKSMQLIHNDICGPLETPL
jgi:hypothetical protein